MIEEREEGVIEFVPGSAAVAEFAVGEEDVADSVFADWGDLTALLCEFKLPYGDEVSGIDFAFCVAVGHVARDEGVDAEGGCVDVHTWGVEVGFADDLWRGVKGGALGDDHTGVAPGAAEVAEVVKAPNAPSVNQDSSIGVVPDSLEILMVVDGDVLLLDADHEVGELNIAVGELLAMKGVDGEEKLSGEVEGCGSREGNVVGVGVVYDLNIVSQGAAIHVEQRVGVEFFEDEEDLVVGFVVTVEGGEVGAFDGLKDLTLGFEGEDISVLATRGFDDDLAAGVCLSFENDGAAAHAEFFGEDDSNGFAF